MLLLFTACHCFKMIYHYNSHTCFVNQTTIAWLYIILLSLVFSISNNVSLMAVIFILHSSVNNRGAKANQYAYSCNCVVTCLFQLLFAIQELFWTQRSLQLLEFYPYKTLLHSVNDKRTNNWLISKIRYTM